KRPSRSTAPRPSVGKQKEHSTSGPSVTLEEAIRLVGDPATRAHGIAMLEVLLHATPASREARRALARARAWDGQHDAALAEYDRLLPGAAGDEAIDLRLERTQVLLW